ncbi:VIT domain-containing protein [Promineifilum sp.]|uniref:VIT domain-containing protein n=1 Tax=Promineifilum sp. TaxID=2664178 RepID=UPI0035B423C1
MKKRLPLLILVLLLAGLNAALAVAQDSYPVFVPSSQDKNPVPRAQVPPRVTEQPVVPPPIDEPRPPIEPPICIDDCPPVWRMEGLEIAYQRVDVTIEDQVATTHVEQLFRNPNDWMLEGTYFFPLPEGAAVSQLTMWVDGQPIEAKLLPAGEARAIYDAIVRQLRDPALLEYVGHDAIQANVFPIPPGEERLIEIEYTHLLTAEAGALRYVYPQSSDLYTNTPLDKQRIRVEIASDEAIRAVYSPSHPVAIDRPDEFRAVAGYEDNNVTPAGDFELYYTVSPEQIGLNLLSYKEPGEDGFFLLLVAPGIEPGEVVARDLIIVLDTSGSMEGEKMAQAQAAAAYVIGHLNPEDRFALVSFSTGVSRYEPTLLPAPAAAPADQPGDYQQYINSLAPVGGTNISGALLDAAALVDPARPTTILFLTDGVATEGITDTQLLLQSVAGALPDNARLFAFGVGDDVDTTLLDTLAANHRGATTYVRPGQAVDEAVSAFYARVGAPVLTDIALDTGGVRVDQVYPVQLPDLFAGTQLVVAGRYRDGGPATIVLTGTTNGRLQTFTYPDQTFRDEGGPAFIPRLWATRAIGHLMQQIRLGGENPELVQSIVALSTRYGIITPYTSFLIEEDDIAAQTGGVPTLEEAADALEAPPAVSGEAAVDRAAVEGEMAAAEAPLALPTVMPAADGGAVAGPVVQAVGSRTFFLRDGIWIDTAYNPDAGEPSVVPFASEAYFALLSDRPELGQALALGEEVLIVVDGAAYRITAAAGAGSPPSPAVASPDQPLAQTGDVTPTAVAEAGGDASDPVGEASAPGVGLQICGTTLILPLALFLGWAAAKRRKL